MALPESVLNVTAPYSSVQIANWIATEILAPLKVGFAGSEPASAGLKGVAPYWAISLSP